MTGRQERQHATSGSPFEATIGFSRGLRMGDRVVIAGTTPIWPDGSCDPDAGLQARRCLEIILAALRDLGAETADVIRTRMYLTDVGDAAAVGKEHGAAFRDVRPASTMVVVSGLLDPRWKVEIEAEAIVG